jgi:hypothetical protein
VGILKYWNVGYDDIGNDGYIAEVDPRDSYYKYALEGTRVRYSQMINRPWNSYERGENEFFSCYLYMLEGLFAGERLHFFKVKLTKEFPFEMMMRRAMNDSCRR